MSGLTLSDKIGGGDDRPLPEIIADQWGFELQSHDINGVRFYSVQDWIAGFAQSRNPRCLWSNLKKRCPELLTECRKLHYVATTDGKKYGMHFAPAATLVMMTSFMKVKVSASGVLRGAIPEKSSVDRQWAGYVYVIRFAEIDGFYKIGMTTRPVKHRISQLECATPFTAQVVHVIPSCDVRRAEAALHARFAGKRVKLEWFRLDQADVDLIRRIKSESDLELLISQEVR